MFSFRSTPGLLWTGILASLCTVAYGGLWDIFSSYEVYKHVGKYNNYYKYHSEELSWGESTTKCESEGATLYYPESEAEVRDVTALLHVWSANVSYINVGISDLEQLGDYKTIDGRPINQVLWADGEPSSGTYNQFRCAKLRDDNKLIVFYCDRPNPFICKKPITDVSQNTPVQESNTRLNNDTYEGSPGALSYEDYTYVEKYNNYYKFHSEELSRDESKEICESEGATLYYPESAAEARDVTALLHVWSANVSYINVGISDLEQLGDYKTIDGRPINQALWPNDEDQSPGTYNQFRCGVFWDDNKLRILMCDHLTPFICKKPITDVSQNTPGQESNTRLNNDTCEGPCGEEDAGTDSSSVFFGRTVGEELSRLPAVARLRAMVGIARVLKEASPETSCHTPALTNG